MRSQVVYICMTGVKCLLLSDTLLWISCCSVQLDTTHPLHEKLITLELVYLKRWSTAKLYKKILPISSSHKPQRKIPNPALELCYHMTYNSSPLNTVSVALFWQRPKQIPAACPSDDITALFFPVASHFFPLQSPRADTWVHQGHDEALPPLSLLFLCLLMCACLYVHGMQGKQTTELYKARKKSSLGFPWRHAVNLLTC